MTENKNSSVLGQRILGAIIDYALIYILYIIISVIYLFISGVFEFQIKNIELIMFVFLWFFLIVFMEYKLSYTIGKKIVGIRTISLTDNKKLTFIQTLKRRIIDPIDIFALGIVSIIIISKSENNQRFGDKLAKTTVVNKTFANTKYDVIAVK